MDDVCKERYRVSQKEDETGKHVTVEQFFVLNAIRQLFRGNRTT